MKYEIACYIVSLIKKDFESKDINLPEEYYDLLAMNFCDESDKIKTINYSLKNILDKKSREENEKILNNAFNDPLMHK